MRNYEEFSEIAETPENSLQSTFLRGGLDNENLLEVSESVVQSDEVSIRNIPSETSKGE